MSIIDPPDNLITKRMWVPGDHVFPQAGPGSALVLHKTAGFRTAEEVASYFQSGPPENPGKVSSQFVVGQDGEVVQCVHLIDGAGANCCLEPGHDGFWDSLAQRFGNLNLCTISIEHVDPATDNSTPLTTAQKAASFRLIKWLVDQYGFDIHNEIKGHNSLDPASRARCPGNYPWQELMDYLKQPAPAPQPTPQPQPVAITYDQEEMDEWHSRIPDLRTGTGIMDSWARGWRAGHVFGAPLEPERRSVTRDGRPIIVQDCLYARSEHHSDTSTTDWYDGRGWIGVF